LIDGSVRSRPTGKLRTLPSMEANVIRIAWATDIHLEFVDDRGRGAFIEQLRDTAPDVAILAGDIGTAHSVDGYLREIEYACDFPVLFVLGNHDFYGGSIESVRSRVAARARSSRRLTYLTDTDVVELTASIGVVGHDGWGDARYGNFAESGLRLNDFRLIRELAGLTWAALGRELHRLGDQAADHLGRVLTEAAERYEHVVVVTHVPPFRESCLNDGRPSGDDGLPFFACKAVGDVILAVADTHPERQFTVLCGHTHCAVEVRVAPNVLVLAGGAEYGDPRLQPMLELR
jgi:predicted phosphohydrolase